MWVRLTGPPSCFTLWPTKCFVGVPRVDGGLYLRDVWAVLDPRAGDVRRATLGWQDGRCRVLGPEDTSTLGPGTVWDAAGLVAVPGLVDSHVHWGGAATMRQAEAPPDPRGLQADFAAFLPAERLGCLAHGVTTIQSMGDPLDWILAMREAVAGGLPGPRVRAVGPIFTAPEGHPAGDLFRSEPWLGAEVCRQFGPGEGGAAAREVASLALRGVDAIKVAYDGCNGTLPRLDEEVLAAIVAAAHRAGLEVHAHVGSATEALTALRSGVDVCEHVPEADGAGLWERVADAMAEHQAAICPTLVALTAGRGAEAARQAARWVAHLGQRGVPVHAGTDLGNAGVRPGQGLHDELSLLVQGGLSATQALAAATVASGGRSGRSPEGVPADWLLVRGDPLSDLGVLRQPTLVVQSGRVQCGDAGKELAG